MTWPIYNNTLCAIYIPLLLWNNKQNQIHFWECYYENVFDHFMVLVLYLVIYSYLCSCNYSLFFAVGFFVCVCVVFSFWEFVRLICLGICYHNHGTDYFWSYTFLQCYFFWQFAIVHSVNTVTFFSKEIEQATNRFTAIYFALHALQKSILLEEKAVVIFIHWVSTKLEKTKYI